MPFFGQGTIALIYERMNNNLPLSHSQVIHPRSLWLWLVEGNFFKLLVLHLLLGLTALITPIPTVLWVYTLILTFFASSKEQKHKILPYLLIYLIPLEVFGRMVNASPFLPWETAKYLGLILLTYGILINRKKSNGLIGLVILFLLLPGVFIAVLKSEDLFQKISFNVLGLVNLCLAIIYFANRSLSKNDLVGIFRFLILGSFLILAYIIIQAPSFAQLEFNLGANFDLTGGFGTNQVSTILGLAAGIGIWLWLMRIQLTKLNTINLLIPGIFLTWALLSFSRGGVISPLFALLLVVLFVKRGHGIYEKRGINPAFIVGLGVLLPALFYLVNRVTDNLLLLRYLGETNSTLAGNQDKSLNLLTTGRWDIFLSDLDIWGDHFAFGVGVGESAMVRTDYGLEAVAAHVELSRLIAEHGIFGFVISLLFLFLPFYVFHTRKNSFNRALIIFCFSIAILTSMHSAMRTFVTPLFYGLAFVRLRND
jgi:hypothetical protein